MYEEGGRGGEKSFRLINLIKMSGHDDAPQASGCGGPWRAYRREIDIATHAYIPVAGAPDTGGENRKACPMVCFLWGLVIGVCWKFNIVVEGESIGGGNKCVEFFFINDLFALREGFHDSYYIY